MMPNNAHSRALLKIETHLLKVHINCEGCKEKVRKLLKKIEGVYSVDIDTEEQMVKVSGLVDPSILIKKLIKCGKKAELWPPGSTYKLNPEQPNINLMQFLPNDFKNMQMKGFGPGNNQDLLLPKIMGNNYKGDDILIGHSRAEDEIASLLKHADYQGNGTGFHELGSQEFHNVPSQIMANRNQGHHFNYPSIYTHDGHANNNMTRDFEMNQPHAFSMYDPNIGYNFPPLPHSYY